MRTEAREYHDGEAVHPRTAQPETLSVLLKHFIATTPPAAAA